MLEQQEKLCNMLAEYTGWKFLKSQRCLRKRIGDIVFDINFYSSKYNLSGEGVEVNCEFEFWNRKLDKVCNVNSKIGFVFFRSENNNWYDITTERRLMSTCDELKAKIDEYVIPVCKRFEEDYGSAIKYLSNEDMQEVYSLRMFGAFEKMKEENAI